MSHIEREFRGRGAKIFRVGEDRGAVLGLGRRLTERRYWVEAVNGGAVFGGVG